MARPKLLLFLARYFHIPSRTGFSAYRTGWAGHVAFSTVVATGLYQLAVRLLGLSIPAGLALALLGVCLLWGLGVIVGVLSHYNPLLMLSPFVVFLAGVFLWPPLLFGFVIAAIGHLLMHPVAAVLRWAAGPESLGCGEGDS